MPVEEVGFEANRVLFWVLLRARLEAAQRWTNAEKSLCHRRGNTQALAGCIQTAEPALMGVQSTREHIAAADRRGHHEQGHVDLGYVLALFQRTVFSFHLMCLRRKHAFEEREHCFHNEKMAQLESIAVTEGKCRRGVHEHVCGTPPSPCLCRQDAHHACDSARAEIEQVLRFRACTLSRSS